MAKVLPDTIRARRRAMADNSALLDGEESQPPPPGIARTPSVFLRMQPDTRQEIGGLLKELYSSPTKALLIFAPAGIIAGLLQQPAVTVFLLNLMALVPLPGLILYSVLVATGDSALLGGLLGAVLGNATEIAVNKQTNHALPPTHG